MEIQRFFLFLIFAFSLMIVWDNWQHQQNPNKTPNKQGANATQGGQGSVPDHTVPTPASHQGSTPKEIKQVLAADKLSTIEADKSQHVEKLIHVKTDFVEAEISSIGGDIVKLSLLKHPDAQVKDKPLVLFERGKGTHNYVEQSGLLGSGLPNHTSLYSFDKDSYVLSGNEDKLLVRLKPQGNFDLKVNKTFTFKRGSYLIETSYELENTGHQPISFSNYFQLVRNSVPPSGSMRFLPTYTGGAIYTEKEKFKKIQFEDIDKGKTEYPKEADNGWIGILQHYFVSAWFLKEKTNREYFTRKLDGDMYAVGMILPNQIINPGQKNVVSSNLYAGPTESNLDSIAPGLGLTVDYGWLTIIATPLFWVMTIFHVWTNNWGIAIILLTVLVKLLFFPLSAASYRSMAKMRVVAPKLEKIKEQYSDDREQLNRAMMELYKTEKINPLGGCLPVLVQIPVFIALYWAILSSVEMRYAPFFGWITDLASPDPYYVLPVIMGLSMIVQMRLNPKPPDPLQAKVMQIMPLAFSVIFFFFPAGLVLYSIVNNILSIAQQWVITRNTESENKGVIKR